MSAIDQNSPRLLQLSQKVSQELLLLSILAPLMCSDLAALTHPGGYATDASDAKGAFVSTSIPKEVSRVLWRTGRKKGGYVRLLSRERALLAKIDADFEEAPYSQGDRPVLRNLWLFAFTLWRSVVEQARSQKL